MLSLIHFYFEVTKNFINFQKMIRRFLRGSSRQGSKDKQAKEKEKANYNLPRIAEVRPCEWPCDNFLREAGIYEDFYSLVENAGLTDFLHDRIDQYLLLMNTFVQNFISILRIHLLQYHFIYMMSSRRCHYIIFARYVEYPLRAA